MSAKSAVDPVSTGADDPPPILERAGSLLERYDALFCDVWGVVHDGYRAFPKAEDALKRFRARGGAVVLVTNAPVPEERVAFMLDRVGASPDARDAIVSSGDIALRHVEAMGYERLYCIGPRDRDGALFSRLRGRQSPLAKAEAILCSGLEDQDAESVEHYVPLLSQALAGGLPFVCANPDLVVDVGGRRYLCAGAIADRYERMGGSVFWAGKPHASAYEAASLAAGRARGSPLDASRTLVIGDAVRTDIAGAEAAGLDALFIAGGIHHDAVMVDGEIEPERLRALFAPPSPKAIAAMRELAW